MGKNSEKMCRICFECDNKPLISPCKCDGSMKWVHRKCLLEWMIFSKSRCCQICKSKYDINFDKKFKFLLSSKCTHLITVFVSLLLLLFIRFILSTFRIQTIIFLIRTIVATICGVYIIQEYYEYRAIQFESILEKLNEEFSQEILFLSGNHIHDSQEILIVFYFILWKKLDQFKKKYVLKKIIRDL